MEKERIEVDAATPEYARWIRHMSSQAYEAAYQEAQRRGLDLSYALSAEATAMWASEILYLMTVDDFDKDDAVVKADKRCAKGMAPELLMKHVRRVDEEENYSMGRQAFLGSYAETLAETWSIHRGNYSGERYTADDLTEIYERPKSDPERQELLDWVPGTEEELRKVLSRRHSR